MKRGLLLFFVLLVPFVSAAGVEKVGIQDKSVVITIQGKVNSQIEFFKDGASRGTYKLCPHSICEFKNGWEFKISLSSTGINEIGDYILRIEEINDNGAAVQSYNIRVNRENLDACIDNTLEGACSSAKPLFCERGELVERCGKGTFSYYTLSPDAGIVTLHTRENCGECPAGICQADGRCKRFVPVLVEEEKNVNETESTGAVEQGCETNNPSGCVSYDNGLACNSCNLCEWFSGPKKCCPKGKVWYEKRHECVTPQEADEEPPTVKLLNEIPQTVEPDSIFELDLAVDDISGVEDVNLNLGYFITIYPDRYEPPFGTQLAAVDTKYIASVDTSYLSSGSYTIYANVKDRKGNEKKELLGSFNIEETSLCREVYPGYNNLNDNRFNIVFVGAGYTNKKNFIEFVKQALGFENLDSENGIFEVEPLKSNKDRFNFWYVDIFEQVKVDIQDISKSCPFNNKVTIGLANEEFRSSAYFRTYSTVSFVDYFSEFNVPIDVLDDTFLDNYCSEADLNDDGLVDITDKYYDKDNNGFLTASEFISAYELSNYNPIYSSLSNDGKKKIDNCILVGYASGEKNQAIRKFPNICKPSEDKMAYGCSLGGRPGYWSTQPVSTAVHEFGHVYASLGDEYLESGKNEKNAKNCVHWTEKTHGANVRQQACLKTAPWKDMIGDGCGENDVVDCVKNNNYLYYDLYNDEIKVSEILPPSILNWTDFWDNSKNEIYCYSGCDYTFNKQRSTFNSIMRSSYISGIFGLFNEKLICEQIKADTGKVGGYCTEKFVMS